MEFLFIISSQGDKHDFDDINHHIIKTRINNYHMCNDMVFIPDYSSSTDMNHEYSKSIKEKKSFKSMVLSRVHANRTTLEIQHYDPFIYRKSKTDKQTCTK